MGTKNPKLPIGNEVGAWGSKRVGITEKENRIRRQVELVESLKKKLGGFSYVNSLFARQSPTGCSLSGRSYSFSRVTGRGSGYRRPHS